MDLRESAIFRRVVTPVTLAGLAATALGVGACSPDSPKAEAGPVVATTTPISIELNAQEVVSGPVGAQKDVALGIAETLDDVMSNTTTDLAEARSQMAKVTNEAVRRQGMLYIDSRLAENARHATFKFQTISGAKAISHNQTTGKHVESINDKIKDPEVKRLAELTLDYQEGRALIMIGDSSVIESDDKEELIDQLAGFIEDEAVRSLAKRAIGSKAVATEFEAQHVSSDQALQAKQDEVYAALYDGSHAQANEINDKIAAFKRAQQQDGA